MKGKLIDFSVQTNTGIISGDDNTRYTFSGTEWKAAGVPLVGAEVDFEAANGAATSIYVVSQPVSSAAISKRLVAAILAFFFGLFGVHKFYLGRTGAGLIMLFVSLFGFIFLGLPTIAIGIIAFVEFIIYLTKSDEEFERIYVQGKRSWF